MKLKILMLNLLAISFSPSVITAPEQTNKSEKTIQLYIYPGCPSCKNVIKFLKDNNWHDRVTFINANDEYNYAKLIEISGKDICPYLVDDVHDMKMPQSRNIMEYFKKIFND